MKKVFILGCLFLMFVGARAQEDTAFIEQKDTTFIVVDSFVVELDPHFNFLLFAAEQGGKSNGIKKFSSLLLEKGWPPLDSQLQKVVVFVVKLNDEVKPSDCLSFVDKKGGLLAGRDGLAQAWKFFSKKIESRIGWFQAIATFYDRDVLPNNWLNKKTFPCIVNGPGGYRFVWDAWSDVLLEGDCFIFFQELPAHQRETTPEY